MAAVGEDSFEHFAQAIGQGEQAEAAGFDVREAAPGEQFTRLAYGEDADVPRYSGKSGMIDGERFGGGLVVVQTKRVAEVATAGLHQRERGVAHDEREGVQPATEVLCCNHDG